MEEARKEIIKLISNQRKYDKHGIAYLIGMMDFHNTKSMFWDTYLRQEIIDEFVRLIHTEKIKYIKNVPSFKHLFINKTEEK